MRKIKAKLSESSSFSNAKL